VLSGILNTLTEAIKILFSDPTSSPLWELKICDHYLNHH
jgi:hypothetical protein